MQQPGPLVTVAGAAVAAAAAAVVVVAIARSGRPASAAGAPDAVPAGAGDVPPRTAGGSPGTGGAPGAASAAAAAAAGPAAGARGPEGTGERPRAAMAGPFPAAGAVPPDPAPPQVAEVAYHVAALHGDRAPTGAVAIATTRGPARAVTVPGGPGAWDPAAPVYLVVMRGWFTALAAPPGVPVRDGGYLYVVLARATLSVLDLGIGSTPPRATLAALGPVTSLRPPRARPFARAERARPA